MEDRDRGDLLTDFGNAQFDCGKWREPDEFIPDDDMPEWLPYAHYLEASTAAKAALVAHIEKLEQERDALAALARAVVEASENFTVKSTFGPLDISGAGPFRDALEKLKFQDSGGSICRERDALAVQVRALQPFKDLSGSNAENGARLIAAIVKTTAERDAMAGELAALKEAARPTLALLDKAIETLADIAEADDMDHGTRRRKAKRIYSEIRDQHGDFDNLRTLTARQETP